ncbi:MAG: DUF1861 family protein [Patescibacteria group bacterium]|jgi:hypothetical protein
MEHFYKYDELEENKTSDPEVKLIDVTNPEEPSLTIYNGGLFMDNGQLHLVARVEDLNVELARVEEYHFDPNKRGFWRDESFVSRMHHQDPSPVFTPSHGIVHSLVRTVSSKDNPNNIINYRSVLWPSSKLKRPIAKGPLGQKGLKIFYYKDEYLVAVRTRNEAVNSDAYTVKSASYVGQVKNLRQITPTFVKRLEGDQNRKIKGFFAPGEWGNVTDSMLLLNNGRIAFMGHIAKYGKEFYKTGLIKSRNYAVIIGLLDPETLETEQVEMVLTARDVYNEYQQLEPKRPDLWNVVYPRTMGFRLIVNEAGDQKIRMVGTCGVGDRYSVIFEMDWPFSSPPSYLEPSNSPFNYPSEYIKLIFQSD